jgi:signal transduction histidine kinase
MAAICMVAVALILGLTAWTRAEVHAGVELAVSGDRIVVESLPSDLQVSNYGGVRPGMVVVLLNGRPLINVGLLEGETVPFDDSAPKPLPIAPPEPVRIPPRSPDELQAIASEPVGDLTAMWPADLERAAVDPKAPVGWYALDTFSARAPLENSATSWFIGLAILLAGGWYLATGRAGAALQPLAIPLAAATAIPLVSLPSLLTLGGPSIAAVGFLVPVGMVPLASGFASLVDEARTRRWLRWVTLGLWIAAVTAGLSMAVTTVWPDLPGFARWGLTGAIAFVPGLVAARPSSPAELAGGTSPSGRLVESTELVVAAASPFVALITLAFTGYSPFTVPILLWILGIVVAGRFTVRPLARLATRAQLQRDLVVAATEAERARVAADIHDDALQDLTLLVRRLDQAGDEEAAAIARTVADRLRAICGDLRLPVLDDLGVGPALDWLVLRIERLAGGEVRLERADGTRPPPEVELAVFRVAQEALANAVKHGRPPIVVRYRATESSVSLSIDDAGPGIEPEAAERATAGGHFGLLNMQQRAEQIGAILDVRRWPAGGTHVALEWRPR